MWSPTATTTTYCSSYFAPSTGLWVPPDVFTRFFACAGGGIFQPRGKSGQWLAKAISSVCSGQNRRDFSVDFRPGPPPSPRPAAPSRGPTPRVSRRRRRGSRPAQPGCNPGRMFVIRTSSRRGDVAWAPQRALNVRSTNIRWGRTSRAPTATPPLVVRHSLIAIRQPPSTVHHRPQPRATLHSLRARDAPPTCSRHSHVPSAHPMFAIRTSRPVVS